MLYLIWSRNASATKRAEKVFLQLGEKMANKSSFGPELTEAEIDALINNTTPGNTKEELLILEFLIKQLFYLGSLDIK